jgi:hypothetical protein
MTCLAFQKFNNAIISSNIVFFDGPTTQIIIYFTLVNIPLDVV